MKLFLTNDEAKALKEILDWSERNQEFGALSPAKDTVSVKLSALMAPRPYTAIYTVSCDGGTRYEHIMLSGDPTQEEIHDTTYDARLVDLGDLDEWDQEKLMDGLNVVMLLPGHQKPLEY